MKVKQLIDKIFKESKIFKNFGVKAICVIISFLFFLFQRFLTIDQKSVPVNLTVINEGSMVSLTHIPRSISVTFKTNESNIGEISSEGIQATLDLSYFSVEGKYKVPIVVELPAEFTKYEPLSVVVRPDYIDVNLEAKVRHTVPIAPKLIGTPDIGYEISSAPTEPAFVTLTGPRSIVDTIDSVPTKEIIVDKKDTSYSEVTSLINSNKMVSMEDPGAITVNVNLVPRIIEKSFLSQKIVFKNLLSELEIVDTAFSADFILSGPYAILSDYEPSRDALSADCSFIASPGEYDVPVSILISNELAVKNLSVDTVRIMVKQKPQEQVEEIVQESLE